jgi:hypothetical protein
MEWQTIITALIVLAAGAYVGRRGWLRLRSIVSAKAPTSASCATGCGGCGSSEKTSDQPALYQIAIGPGHLVLPVSGNDLQPR